MHVSKYVCMCMCNDVLSGSRGCERPHASAEQTDHLRCMGEILTWV